MKGPLIKKNNRNGSHVVPSSFTLTINSTVFYQLNNHYISFSVLNGNEVQNSQVTIPGYAKWHHTLSY